LFRKEFHRAEAAFILVIDGSLAVVFQAVAYGEETAKIVQFQKLSPHPAFAGDHGGVTFAGLMIKDAPYPCGGTGQDSA
jgi:hypothetical protein